jgi:hypothetical protein
LIGNNKHSSNKEIVSIREIYYTHFAGLFYPGGFLGYPRSVAAYDRDGTVVQATKLFCEIAGIKWEDICCRKVNIFNILNGENAGLPEIMRNVFNDIETTLPDMAYPFHIKTDAGKSKAALYMEISVFPISYEVNNEDVRHGGILLLEKEKTDSG